MARGPAAGGQAGGAVRRGLGAGRAVRPAPDAIYHDDLLTSGPFRHTLVWYAAGARALCHLHERIPVERLRHRRHPDHRHRHPRRRTARPVDVAGLVEVGRPRAPRRVGRGQGGGGVVHRRPAPRRRRRAGDGRLARAPAVPPPPLRRHRPGVVGRHRAAGADGRLRRQAQILYPNVAVFDAKSIVNMGDTELQLACIRAYNDFLVDFGDEQPGRFIAVAGAAVLGSRRHAGRDRALRRERPQGHRLHPGPALLRPARADRPLLGPDVGIGRRRRGCRSTSTSPRATSTCSTSATPTTASTPTTRRWACRSSWPTPGRSPS